MHTCGRAEHPAERFLTYLRERLQRPAVAYLRPPVRIAGGFDTRIYAFQLAHVPPDFAGRLIIRIFREIDGGQRATAEGALQNALASAAPSSPPAQSSWGSGIQRGFGAGPVAWRRSGWSQCP